MVSLRRSPEVYYSQKLEETLDDFLKTHHSPKVKEAILRKIYIALLCVWEKGGVFSDMKPGNVMVNPAASPEDSLVKLIDLGSICTDIRNRDAVCTFPPPHTWAFFNRGRRPQDPTESGCTEKTLIWSFVIAALSVYAWEKWEKHYNKLIFYSSYSPYTIVGSANLEYINNWMAYFESQLDKDSNILTNVRKCLSPFERDDWRDDWRTSSKPPPFKFSMMIPKKRKIKRKRKSADSGALPKRQRVDYWNWIYNLFLGEEEKEEKEEKDDEHMRE